MTCSIVCRQTAGLRIRNTSVAVCRFEFVDEDLSILVLRVTDIKLNYLVFRIPYDSIGSMLVRKRQPRTHPRETFGFHPFFAPCLPLKVKRMRALCV